MQPQTELELHLLGREAWRVVDVVERRLPPLLLVEARPEHHLLS